MRDYEQMELDITLDSERTIKDNLQEVTRFALGKNIQEEHPDTVRNKHEGYGIAAERYSALLRAEKAVSTEMKTMLSLLPNDEADFINICGSLYNAAIDTAMQAINMAAQSRRIMEDLYGAEPKTPLEEYAESLENNEDDGFETADETDETDSETDGYEELSEEELKRRAATTDTSQIEPVENEEE